MMKLSISAALAAGLLAFTGTAQAQGVSGSVGIWAKSVIPTSEAEENGDSCGNGYNDFCENVLGFGGSAALMIPLGASYSIYGDLVIDTHEDTERNGGDDDALYNGLGLHLINTANPNMPWGGFLFAAKSNTHGHGDDPMSFLGFGAEVGFNSGINKFGLQAGRLNFAGVFRGDDHEDALDHLNFIRGTWQRPMFGGDFTGGLAYGMSDDSDASSSDDGDTATWLQLTAEYAAPLGSTNAKWFVGYQGDYMKFDQSCCSPGAYEKVLLNSVIVGLRITFGGAQSPFTTPNFSAPLGNAAQMN